MGTWTVIAAADRWSPAEEPDDQPSKELCEAFGGGVFSDSAHFPGCDEGLAFDLPTQWRAALATDGDGRFGSVSAVEPYAICAPGGKGLAPRGSTEWADEYCRLIDAERPGHYPVLARADDGAGHQHAMSTSEFLHRVLTDVDFQPIGVARNTLNPTFEPGSATIRDCASYPKPSWKVPS
ncbi:hypothetical protein [Streptomyces sp. NPDC056690]|uniref:hypothetical protein n=1 Tax=unclassified Streptomyces TaxID=2593676 RepID=UPI0036428C7B